MSLSEMFLQGLSSPLPVAGAQLPHNLALYSGGPVDPLKLHELKYKGLEQLEEQSENNRAKVLKELEEYDMDKVGFVGSNALSRREYLLTKLSEDSKAPSVAESKPDSANPLVEGAVALGKGFGRYAQGIGNDLQINTGKLVKNLPMSSSPLFASTPAPAPAPAPAPTPAPERGFADRYLGGLKGLAANAMQQGSYGAQQLVNKVLERSQPLRDLVDDEQEALILANLMQGSSTPGQRDYYKSQFQRRNFAPSLSNLGDQDTQLEEIRSRIADGDRDKEKAFDYFYGISPEAKLDRVTRFGGDYSGFTPAYSYAEDVYDDPSRLGRDLLTGANELGSRIVPGYDTAFRKARSALNLADRAAVTPAQVASQIPQYSDQQIQQGFDQLISGFPNIAQLTEIIPRNILTSIQQALALGDEGTLDRLVAQLSPEQAALFRQTLGAQ